MTRKLLFTLALLTAVAACTGTYSGYRSDCACDFEALEPADLELV
ncbi:hypothetical protein [uncultured Ruegeria sp.]|nr:hypothetical protein [uncultured Ruegeria sp.]